MSCTSEAQALILKKLEEYGDSLVGDSKKSDSKQKANRGNEKSVTKKETTNLKAILSNPVNGKQSRRQKKRLKKKLKKLNSTSINDSDCVVKKTKEKKISAEEDDETFDDDFDDEFNDDISDDGEEVMKFQTEKKGSNRQLQMFSDELGLAEFIEQMKSSETDSKKENEPEVVVFQSHKRKINDNSQESGRKVKFQKEPIPNNPEFDMETARFDVRKLAISGYKGKRKEGAMRSLLVKLGAKPPKKQYVSYKEYQEKRKKAVERERKKQEKNKRHGMKTHKMREKKRKKDRNDIGVLDGQVGRWQAGVQIVKKDDIKGIQKSKIKT